MRITQKKWFYAPVLIVVMALFAILSYEKGEAKPPKDTIAVVNGAVITQEDLDRELSMAQQEISNQDQPSAEQLADIKKKLLDSLITRKVLYQESEKKE